MDAWVCLIWGCGVVASISSEIHAGEGSKLSQQQEIASQLKQFRMCYAKGNTHHHTIQQEV